MANELTAVDQRTAVTTSPRWQEPSLNGRLADLVLGTDPLPTRLPVLTDVELADAEQALAVYRAAPRTSSPRAVDRVMAKLVVAYPAARVSVEEASARLDVYAEQLSDIPADVLMAGAMAAARTMKFFPSISEIRAAAMSQPAPPRIQRQWRLSQLLEARARRGADDLAVERCRPEEAAEIVAALGGRFAAAADPSRPKPQGGNPDRGARMPSREDYVRMFGVDPGDAIAGNPEQMAA